MAASDPPAAQDPQKEGDTNRVILGNEFQAPRPSMEVHMVGTQLVMTGGRIHGIKPNFLIGIFPEGVTNLKATPTWTATVTVVRTGDCDLKLTDESERLLNGHYEPLQANAQGITIDGKPDGSIKVHIGELPNEVQLALKQQLANAPMVDMTAAANDCDIRLSPTQSAGPADPSQWDVIDAKGDSGKGANIETLKLDRGADQSAAKLSEELQSIARRNAVFALNPDQPASTNIEMRLVPVYVDPSSKLVTKLLAGPALADEQKASDQIQFAVQVRLVVGPDPAGEFQAFPTLLNVNPHPVPNPPHSKPPVNRVAQLWPEIGRDGKPITLKQFRTLTAESGRRYLGVKSDQVTGQQLDKVAAFNVDYETDGLGPELFKVIATDSDESFGPLLVPNTSRGGRGGISNLGTTLSNYAKMQPRTRAGGNVHTDIQHWCTAAITLNVIRAEPSKP